MTELQTQTYTRYVSTLVFAVFFLVLAPLSASDVIPTLYPELAASNISEDLTKGANAVIRYQKIHVVLEEVDLMVVTESTAITVMNKRGDHFLSFYEGFKASSDEISDISIEYVNAAGFVITKVKKKELEEVTPYDGASLISDHKAIFAGFETGNYPITIKYSFKFTSSTTVSLPTWMPITSSRLSVETSEYSLVNMTDSEVAFQPFNLEGYDITSDRPFHYKLTNAKRISGENYTPHFARFVPMVYFRPSKFSFEGIEGAFNDWDSYGKWIYDALLKPRMNMNQVEAFKDLKKVVSPDQSKIDIIKQVYEYVQQNTRYILVSLDDGGLVPMKAQDVHDLKYGDCKALTFYTQELLKLYGIPSNYVINEANPRNQISFTPEYCDVIQGNHIILQVPLESDTLWMDCTSNDNPFNFLGSFTDDRLVLAVNESGGTLVRTPKYGVDLNKDVTKTEIRLGGDGSISVDYNIVNHGLKMDRRQRFYKMSPADQIDDLKDHFNHLLNLKISDLKVDVDKDNLQSTEHFVINASEYVEQAGQYYIIPLRFDGLSVPNLGKKKTRHHPILFERACKEVREDTYIIPEGFIPNLEALNVEHQSEYGKYTRVVELVSNTQFKIRRSFELFEAEYPAEDYLKIRSFFNKIRKEDLAKMSIENKNIRP